jgi:microcystin-dependent protein
MELDIGTILMFAGNFAPSGWAFCNGQTLAISQYEALFSILGTTYGGNGTSNFCLPDLRGRAPIHWGSGPGLTPYNLGEITGAQNVTLSNSQMPAHSHLLGVDKSGEGGHFQPGPNHTFGSSTSALLYSTNPPDSNMSPASIELTGGSQPFSIIQPVLAVSFIIALTGYFPSRN